MRAEPAVTLPAYAVTDSRQLPPPESWRYSQMPGFEILSNASDRSTLHLLTEFQRFNQAIGVVWPALLGNESGSVSLILCGQGGKFEAFVPATAKAGPDRSLASLFLRDAKHSAIVLDFVARDLMLSGLEANALTGVESNGSIEIDPYTQFYRAYVHSLLARMNPRLPAWTEEGLAQLLMGMRVTKKTIEFAKLEDPAAVSVTQSFAANVNAFAGSAASDASAIGAAVTAATEDRDFNSALHHRVLLPLPEMFAVAHDSPTALNPVGNRWAKQSYAFVHLCLYGLEQRYQKGFLTFIARLAKEPMSEALFTECFGINTREMLFKLRGYIDSADYKSLQFNATKGGGFSELPPIALREASPTEIGRLKGEALMMAGHMDAARAALIAPYTRGERDPALLASLGFYEQAAGHNDRAQEFLEASIGAKGVRPDANLELACMKYQAALAKPAAADGALSARQADAILALLLPARAQPPVRPEIYELLAETLMHSADPLKRENVEILFEGVNRFPRRLGLVYYTAVLSLRVGEPKGAAGLVELGLRLAPDESIKARFAALKTSLPPETTTPAVKARS